MTESNAENQTWTDSSNDLIIVNIADLHSAYDHYPYLLQAVRDLAEQHAGGDLVVLINGDVFEPGNVVAQRSAGEADWLFLERLRQIAPVIVNLGNHEFDFQSPREFVRRAGDIGIELVGNIGASDQQYLARPVSDIVFKGKTLRILGFATNSYNTYPAEVRGEIVLPDPVEWFNETFPELDDGADFLIIASHAGIHADLQILPMIEGDQRVLYMVGSHNHLILKENVRGTEYMQNGLKGEQLAVTRLSLIEDSFRVETSILRTSEIQGADAEMGAAIQTLRDRHLGPDELQSVGLITKDKSLPEAASWAVEGLRSGSGADVAVLNHTSFGSGLRAGKLKRHRFDEFIRFDNAVMMAEVDGRTLKAILQLANQHLDTAIGDRSGDFLYSTRIEIDPEENYKLATSAWIADSANQERYLGTSLDFRKVPGVTIKDLLIKALDADQGASD